ncbi:TIGR01212 family radical SAM protein [Paludibacter sp. 221]|uniref:TIGR01212 family radical SAM protein n=1 Tax=Paludibacter sp. 221 TaxID=2302939 RepID=UPI0013CF5468|nr:TIGR01212 family radical SAM protein [Paludibacter sp. 221]NDV47412.1 TIGR01212 family radical SAM protein [Paludibacter sp. 221]
MDERYLNYNLVLKEEFSGRIQKISVNAGFTCPNRDGSKGVGGCTYCNNQTFSPEYCKPTSSVSKQVEEGIAFFKNKYRTQRYLAYFQSYTNTYGDTEYLKSLYAEALSHPKVIGLVIGTRPDCVSDELLDYFAELAKKYYIMIEYGIESTNDETLELINRGHDYACCEEVVVKTSERGIRAGAHLILGLPKESREIIISHADKISKLPLTALKLHQLQIIKGTKMAQQYVENPEWFQLFGVDEYIDVAVDFVERLNPRIAIERFVSQSPADLLIAPDWGLKNFEFTARIKKRLQERNTWQGRLFNGSI